MGSSEGIEFSEGIYGSLSCVIATTGAWQWAVRAVHRAGSLKGRGNPISPRGGPIGLLSIIGRGVISEALLLLIDLGLGHSLQSGEYPIWLPVGRKGGGQLLLRRTK